MVAGILLGAVLLEAVLRANPTLLPHGMALPVPVDPRVEVREYQVRLSDADVFYWMPGRIRPIEPSEDTVEAMVRFETDELGFPNHAPLLDRVDVVVLGRSYSLGAQAAAPWTELLSERTGWRVLNLSQAGSGIDTKVDYLRRYGLPRRPRWVILEVLPSMDVVGFQRARRMIIGGLPFLFAQDIARRLYPPATPSTSQAIYPIALSMPGRTEALVFFDYYVDALSVNQEEILASRQWMEFERSVRQLQQFVEGSGGCLAILYAPTNAEIYLPLATNPSELAPILEAAHPWCLNEEGDLVQDAALCDGDVHRLNPSAPRAALMSLSSGMGLFFIDPSGGMAAAATSGQEPFMRYDTHWSAIGHEIVANSVADALNRRTCP
jgi:hypothetical protein